MRSLRIPLVLLLTSAALAQAPQAPPAPGPPATPGTIEGVVVESGTNKPLGKVRVNVERAAPAANSPAAVAATTGADGKFLLAGVLPGQYRIVAARDAYARGEYGQKYPGGPSQTITVSAGQAITGIQITMTKGGVISGIITDGGRPVGAANVHALRAAFQEDHRAMSVVVSARTNDFGEYRLFWLAPGEYYVVVEVFDAFGLRTNVLIANPDGTSPVDIGRGAFRPILMRAIGAGSRDSEGHLPVYFPNTLDPQRAQTVQIRPNSEVRIDIDSTSQPLKSVRGFIDPPPGPGPDGRPTQSIPIGMLPLTPLFGEAGAVPNSLAQESGAFEIQRVIPGSYVLYANPTSNVAGRTRVDVRDRDVDNVVLKLAPSLTVTGQVIFESQNSSSDPRPATRVLLRTDPYIYGNPTYVGVTLPDGSLTIPSAFVPPQAQAGAQAPTQGAPTVQLPAGPLAGDYRVAVLPYLMPPAASDALPILSAPGAGNLYVKSIRLGDADVLNDGLHLQSQPQDKLVITIGSNPGSLEGRVLDERKQPVADIWVAIIPEGGLRFHVDHKYTSTDSQGRFQIANVPPGDYKAFAWEQAQRGAWQDPGFVRNYEDRGTTFHVDDGKKATVDLTSIPPQN